MPAIERAFYYLPINTMPKPTTPPCPDCSHATKKNGFVGKNQKYKCKSCSRQFTGNEVGRPKSPKPATAAERQAKSWANKTRAQKDEYNRKQRERRKKNKGG